MGVDLSEYENGDRINITLEDGETFDSAYVAGRDHDPAETQWEQSHFSLTIEGDWWDQVNDRVDSEVLNAQQSSERGGEPLKDASLYGTVWAGEVEEASEPEYKELGTIESVERVEE